MKYDIKIRPQNNNTSIERLQEWVWPTRDTGLWDGPLNDWESSHSIKYFKYLKKTDVVIQAGGACGMYPRMFAERFQRVFTFEPNAYSFYCLVNNCSKENIVKFQAALGAGNQMCDIHGMNEDNVGICKIKEIEVDRIPIFAIDSFNFSQCDLICLDTEGYEDKIILGALRTIEKFKPVITIELGMRDEILSKLTPLGYKVEDQSVSDHIFVCK